MLNSLRTARRRLAPERAAHRETTGAASGVGATYRSGWPRRGAAAICLAVVASLVLGSAGVASAAPPDRRHRPAGPVSIITPTDGSSVTQPVSVLVRTAKSARGFGAVLDGRSVTTDFRRRSATELTASLGGEHALRPGPHTLTVRARDRHGHDGSQSVRFVVDPRPDLAQATSGLAYPVGAYIDTMANWPGTSCTRVSIGSDFYPSIATTPNVSTCVPGAAYVALFDAGTLGYENSQYLPIGKGAGAALSAFLAGYVGDGSQHLVVLTGPAGSVAGDPVLGESGLGESAFSFVFRLAHGVGDLADIVTDNLGAENVGKPLDSSGAGADGQLRGWLEPAVQPDSSIRYGFTPADHAQVSTSDTTHVEDVPFLISWSPTGRYFDPTASYELLRVPHWSQTTTAMTFSSAGADAAGRWRFTPTTIGDGSVSIVNTFSSLCLSISNGDGTVEQSPCDTSVHQSALQQWRLQPQAGDTFSVVSNLNPRLALSVSRNTDGTYTPVMSASAPERFQISSPALSLGASGGSGPTPLVVTGGTTGQQLTVQPARPGPDHTGDPSQQWFEVPSVAADGEVKLVDAASNECVDVLQTQPANQVGTYPCDPNARDQANQLWRPLTAPAHGVSGVTALVSDLSSEGVRLVLTLTGDPTSGQTVALAADSSTSGQRWTLPGSNTMTVDDQRYASFNPATTQGVQVLGLDSALRPVAGTPAMIPLDLGSDVDQSSLTQLAQLLSDLRSEHAAVLVQTIGQPRPTAAAWNDVATQIGTLGGTPAAFNALDGTSDYALLGCDGCTGAVQAGPAVTGQDSASSLTGVLGRTPTSDWQPVTGGPGDTDDGFLPLVWQRPQPWPVPAGVSAAADLAAREYLAPRIGLTANACYTAPTPDVRSAYCAVNTNWADKKAALADVPYAAGNGFSDADLSAVKQQLQSEFSELSAAQQLITNMQAPLTGASTSLAAQLPALVSHITADISSQVQEQQDVQASMAAIFSTMVALGGVDAPAAVEFGLTLLEGGFDIADTVWGDSDGESGLADIHVRAADLVAELQDRIQKTSDGFARAFDLIASDPVKLKTIAANVAGPWASTDVEQQQIRQAAVNGADQQLYSELLPAYYQRWSVPVPPPGKRVSDYTCTLRFFPDDELVIAPFAGEPDSATYQPITGFSPTGTRQSGTVWALGRADSITQLTSGRRSAMLTPPAQLTDPMFTARNSGGVGMSKVQFFSQSSLPTKSGTPTDLGESCGY